MKTNKEFIENIYVKYDEHLREKEKKKITNIKKVVNSAAMLIILCGILLTLTGFSKQKELVIEDGKIEEAKINLDTVGSFENLYSILKENNKTNLIDSDIRNNIEEETKLTDNYKTYNSVTNTQVKNVDEADIVKISDNYIYYISEYKIIILKADTEDTSEKVGEINFEQGRFYPLEMYVKDNKLIVIGNEGEENAIKTEYIEDVLKIQNNKSVAIIYDITKKEEPKEIRRIEVDGTYLSSRMIGDSVYFVSNKIIYNSEILKNPIEDIDEKKYMVYYKDTNNSQEEKTISYEKIYCFNEIQSLNYLIMVGINIKSEEEADIQTFLGGGNYIYSSENNMYLATPNVEYDENYKVKSSKTNILKFKLNNGKIQFRTKAEIEGIINNQFSMDEKDGYFRIATTTGNVWNIDENTSNNLYILNEKLEKIGEITNFAKEERIYSVRYVGDKAYVVTFKQTDPFFIIDLSNPEKPQILGELKLPGYSSYLHPYDETHIIGIGYETKEDGTRITTDGLKMVMFDVTNVSTPKVLFKINIGDKNTSTEITFNHKAILYSKEKNIIAFPILNYGKKQTNSRAVIYEIDLEKGFILKGEIQHLNDNYKENIDRIVYVNDNYYTLSKELIKVINMNTLEIVKKIEIK